MAPHHRKGVHHADSLNSPLGLKVNTSASTRTPRDPGTWPRRRCRQGFRRARAGSRRPAPRHAAHAAEHDDRESLERDHRAHRGIDEADRRDQRAGKRRQRRPRSKGKHRDAVGVDADQQRALAVLRRGANRRSGDRARQKQQQGHHQDRRRAEQNQPVRRHQQAEDRDDAAIGRLEVPELFAPDVLRDRFEKQHHAERGDHRVDRRIIPERAEHQPLQRRAGERQRHDRDGHRGPVVEPRRRHQRVGQVRAPHVEMAVREVRHLQRCRR